MTEKESDISKIITGCLENDRLSQRQLYDRYAPEMFALCRRYASSEVEAEDLMMEGFMNVFKNLGTYRHKCSFASWVRSVMLNVAISHFRNSGRFRLQIPTEDMSALESVAEEQITTSFVAEQLLEVFQEMPEMMRVVFNLKVVDDFSFAEIAKMVDRNENAVRNSFLRARKWLIKRLENENV